jgi:hypothetical protein
VPGDGSKIYLGKEEVDGHLWRECETLAGRFEVSSRRLLPFGALIRTCLSFLCEDQGEIILHASGVLRKGRLWLFSGQSGSGKSTIATELNGGGDVFAMDQVVVSVGTDGGVVADSTPFSDDDGVVLRREQVPVSGIVLIEQAARDELVALSTHDIIARLLAHSSTSFCSGVDRSRQLDILGSVVEKTKIHGLRFTRSDRFWTLLDNIDRSFD